MEHSLSRILIETTVRQTLKGLRKDPKRSTRNLVDMAVQFSEGRGQSRFFTRVQAVLREENSPYYDLVQDAVNHVGTEHLVTFGMNLGYNSCIRGAGRIRRQERQLGYHIPWAVLLEINISTDAQCRIPYHQIMEEGEWLGIYTWMIFAHGDPLPLFPMIKEHPDSAIVLFCRPEYVTDTFLDAADQLYHLMPVVGWGEGVETACAMLRRRGIPYSVYAHYTAQDVKRISSGGWLRSVQQLHPIFFVLTAQRDCQGATSYQVYRAMAAARCGQRYRTVPWELGWDTRNLDEAISQGGCGMAFDSQGNFCTLDGRCAAGCGNLFRDGLSGVLERACSATN